MSKFNITDTRAASRSPIQTETRPSGHTFEGAPGFARDEKSELFLLAVANMVQEGTFYEKADDRDERFERLVHQVAVGDPAWMLGFIGWLRDSANMRSASLVAAAEAVKARLNAKQRGGSRALVSAALKRADEPGELLAYWTSHYGRAIPKPIKRGVADAAVRMYNEYTLLKYDTDSHGYRFGDVLDLTHPTPKDAAQDALFRFALDRRHGRAQEIPTYLSKLFANATLRKAAIDHPETLLNSENLKRAGMTWEDALSLVGSRVDKAKLWDALIPTMGIMALARNLRNFDEVEGGISEESVRFIIDRLSDPEQVARSRMFPFRWLSAFRESHSLRWAYALEKALTASLANVPALPGRSLILVDMSGSMSSPAAGKLSKISRADVAKIFGAALAMRTDPTLVAFSDSSERVAVPAGGSLLRVAESIPFYRAGTRTRAAIDRWYAGHNRVIVVTDEQTSYSGYAQIYDHSHAQGVFANVPPFVPCYTWNLAGYQFGQAPSGLGTRHTFGGLSDAAFKLIPLLERGKDAPWPWEMGA